MSVIQAQLNTNVILYVDIPGIKNPNELFTNIRPDITVLHNNTACILELTCCYKRNVDSSKLYKMEKYKNPHQSSKIDIHFLVNTIELSSLGFVCVAGLNKLCRVKQIPGFVSRDIRRMGEIALRCSFFIFSCRHKPWPNDKMDPYIN